MEPLRAMFRMDRIGIAGVCMLPCPRAVWVVSLALGGWGGLHVFLGDMSRLFTWMSG